MTKLPKTVMITKTVPVTDIITLSAWLNQEMAVWVKTHRDGGVMKATVGSRAIDLILQAGFTIERKVCGS